MRPVERWAIGTHGVEATYHPYSKAKLKLSENLGLYCSYCETCINDIRSLAVEHILPKAVFTQLEDRWENFLVACATCNGMDNKGNTLPHPDCHLPHTHNTFLSLKYERGGRVLPNPSLSEPALSNAKRLLSLTGIDKLPTPTDRRWMQRAEIWNMATQYRATYDMGRTTADTILDLARYSGHWSIWFTVFDGCDEVR